MRRRLKRSIEIHTPGGIHLRQAQAAQRGGGQGIGSGIEALHRIGQLPGGHQTQVALGQAERGRAQQRPQPAGLQRMGQIGGCSQFGGLLAGHGHAHHVGMAVAGHAVGQHACPGQRAVAVRLVVAQAVGHRAKGLRHGRGIDHRQHGQAQQPGQVGGTGCAVVQAHHPLDQNQVGLLRGAVQALAHIGLARHPQIHLMHRRTAGQLVPERVQKIRPALEHPHPPPGTAVQAGQRRRDRGFALAGSRGRDQDGGAAGGSAHRWGAQFRVR